MPQFILNAPQRYWQAPGERGGRPAHPFYALDTFARGYVEAMFFTNGDIGDEDRPDLLNELGTDRLTKAAVATIKADCDKFRAIVLPGPGGATVADLLDVLERERGYTAEQAGQDLWFTRQGHGVGFWSREELESDGTAAESFGDILSEAARPMGESYVEPHRGWIHVR